MEQKDKELLLKDLCARLPYEVKCNVGEKIPYTLCRIEIDNVNGHLLDFIETKDGLDMQVYLSEVKPYLFPLSSMTKEQEEKYGKCYDIDLKNSAKNLKDRLDGKDVIDGHPMYNHIDWLNNNHFDYRGLIEKGLAIDATGLNIY